MVGIILFIIGALAALGGLGYLLYLTISLVRSPMVEVNFKKTFQKYAIFAGVFVAGLTLLCIGIPLWNNCLGGKKRCLAKSMLEKSS